MWGALRLALFDRRGLTQLDVTRRGVWFSFIAPLAMLPIMLWFPQMMDKDSADAADADTLWWLRQVLGYFVALLGFPLAMYYVTGWLELRRQFFTMVAAMNWAAVWQTLMVLCGYFLYLSDAVPFFIGNAALLLASGFTLVYLVYVMRESLDIKTIVALPLVMIMALVQYLSFLLTKLPV